MVSIISSIDAYRKGEWHIHEMAITRSVVDIVLKHAKICETEKVLTVRLQIGELRDIVDSLMQKCFSYLARDTVAGEAILIIDRIPLTIQCRKCGEVFPANIHQMEETCCPKCQEKQFNMITGQEFFINEIEVI